MDSSYSSRLLKIGNYISYSNVDISYSHISINQSIITVSINQHMAKLYMVVPNDLEVCLARPVLFCRVFSILYRVCSSIFTNRDF
jgi:hypothetical protein